MRWLTLAAIPAPPGGCAHPDRRLTAAIIRRQAWLPSRQPRRSHVTLALLPSGSASSRDAAEGITIPVNYAELLGLQDVQLPLQPAVEKAYDDLINTPLEEGYSELARLGKEKLLFAARDRLHGVRGRTALLSPSVQVEPLLLPGAMALLHQVKRYDLVIQLSEDGAGLGARQIRSSSRDTLREFERDMALATALAQCGLADHSLKEGKPALACTRLQEALQLLVDASHPIAGGSLLRGADSGAGAQPGQNALAPKLQADIRAALAEYHPEALADYLQVPLDRADYELRLRELNALRQWVAAPAGLLQRRGQRPVLTPEYMARIVPCLTAGELCSLYDWERLAAGGNSARCPWYFPGLLKRAALAHLVTGFVDRRPALILTALKLFLTLKKGDDVALSVAMCQLLLGDAAGALHTLEEDERAQQHQWLQEQARGLPMPPGGNGVHMGSSSLGAAASGPPGRHAVMQFIRAQSPQGQADLRPGLAAFATWWLESVAYPEFQDTALGAAPRPDLAAYFEDVRVQAFLASQNGNPAGGALGLLAQARAFLLSPLETLLGPGTPGSSARSSSTSSGLEVVPSGGSLLRKVLQLLAGAAILAAALVAAYRVRGSGWGSVAGWLQPPMAATTAEDLPQVSEEAAAADIGLPPGALRRLFPWQHERQQGAQPHQPHEQEQWQQQPPQQQQQQVEQKPAVQQPVQVLSKSAADKIVKDWLIVKADAMGPRHNTARLAQVLDEPMLSAVAQEAAEAQDSGWYWNIRPRKSKVDSLDTSSFNSVDGTGHVSVLATVEESAELRAVSGEPGESYKTTYQVEYTMVYNSGSWKIASALVLAS